MRNRKFLIIYSLLVLTSCFNCIDWRENVVKQQSFKGIITLKTESSYPCQGLLVINGLKIDTIRICYCGLEGQFWDNINYGDTIYKEQGSINIVHIKNGESIEYNYPCCDH